MDPPDSMPNSEVKHNSADGSVGLPHVRVGHRQAPIYFHFLKSEDKRYRYLCIHVTTSTVYKSVDDNLLEGWLSGRKHRS